MGIKIKPIQPRRPGHTDRIRLARSRLTALILRRIPAEVPVVKHPERRAVDEDVAAAAHVHEPGHAALGVGGAAVRKGRVGEGGRGRPGGWGQGGRAVTLPVGGFALLHGDEDVLRVVEAELVEGGVLEGDAVQPGGLGRFDQHAAADGDRVLARDGEAVQVVVGDPAPHVVDVGGRGGG